METNSKYATGSKLVLDVLCCLSNMTNLVPMDGIAKLIHDLSCKVDQFNTQFDTHFSRILGLLRQSPPVVLTDILTNCHTFAYCGEGLCKLVIDESSHSQ